MNFKTNSVIKRTLTFVLAFAMIATSLYVAPVANAEEINENEEIVLNESSVEEIIGEGEAEEADVRPDTHLTPEEEEAAKLADWVDDASKFTFVYDGKTELNSSGITDAIITRVLDENNGDPLTLTEAETANKYMVVTDEEIEAGGDAGDSKNAEKIAYSIYLAEKKEGEEAYGEAAIVKGDTKKKNVGSYKVSVKAAHIVKDGDNAKYGEVFDLVSEKEFTITPADPTELEFGDDGYPVKGADGGFSYSFYEEINPSDVKAITLNVDKTIPVTVGGTKEYTATWDSSDIFAAGKNKVEVKAGTNSDDPNVLTFTYELKSGDGVDVHGKKGTASVEVKAPNYKPVTVILNAYVDPEEDDGALTWSIGTPKFKSGKVVYDAIGIDEEKEGSKISDYFTLSATDWTGKETIDASKVVWKTTKATTRDGDETHQVVYKLSGKASGAAYSKDVGEYKAEFEVYEWSGIGSRGGEQWNAVKNGENDYVETIEFEVVAYNISQLDKSGSDEELTVTFQSVENGITLDDGNKTFTYNGVAVADGNIKTVAVDVGSSALDEEIKALTRISGEGKNAEAKITGSDNAKKNANKGATVSSTVEKPKLVLTPYYAEGAAQNLTGSLTAEITINQYDIASDVEMSFKTAADGLTSNETLEKAGDKLYYNAGKAICKDNIAVSVKGAPTTTGALKTEIEGLCSSGAFKYEFKEGTLTSGSKVENSLSNVIAEATFTGKKPQIDVKAVTNTNFKWTFTPKEFLIKQGSPKDVVTINGEAVSSSTGDDNKVTYTSAITVPGNYSNKTSAQNAVIVVNENGKPIEVTTNVAELNSGNKFFTAKPSATTKTGEGKDPSVLIEYTVASTVADAAADDNKFTVTLSSANFEDIVVTVTVEDDDVAGAKLLNESAVINAIFPAWDGALKEELNTETKTVKTAATDDAPATSTDYYITKATELTVGYLGRTLTAADFGKLTFTDMNAAGATTTYTASGATDARLYEETAAGPIEVDAVALDAVLTAKTYKAVSVFEVEKTVTPSSGDPTTTKETYKYESAFTVVPQKKLAAAGVLEGVTIGATDEKGGTGLNVDKEILAEKLVDLITYNVSALKGTVLEKNSIVVSDIKADAAYQYKNDPIRKAVGTNEKIIDLTGNGLKTRYEKQPYATIKGATKNTDVAGTGTVDTDNFIVLFDVTEVNKKVEAHSNFTVTFNEATQKNGLKTGYVPALSYQVQAGKTIADPNYNGITRWALDKNGTKIWNFATDIVNADLDLYEVVQIAGGPAELYTLYEIPAQTYNGKALAPVVTVIENATGKALAKSKLTVGVDGSTKNAKTVGNHTVSVTVKKKGNQAAIPLGTTTFTIEPAAFDISDAGVTLTKAPILALDSKGAPKKKVVAPVKSIKIAGANVKYGTGYTITVTNSEGAPVTVDAKGKVTFDKAGVYKIAVAAGSDTANYKVNPKAKADGPTVTVDYVVGDTSTALSKAKITGLAKYTELPAFDATRATSDKSIKATAFKITLGKLSAEYALDDKGVGAWTDSTDKDTAEFIAALGDPVFTYTGGPGKVTVTVPAKDASAQTGTKIYYGEASKTTPIAAAAAQKLNAKEYKANMAAYTQVDFDGEGKNLEDVILAAAEAANPTNPAIKPANVDLELLKALGYVGKDATTIPGGKPLSTFVDITYSKNVAAGTAKVTIKAKPFSGKTGTIKTTFKIAPVSLNKALFNDDETAFDMIIPSNQVIATPANEAPKKLSLSVDPKAVDSKNKIVATELNIDKILSNKNSNTYLVNKKDFTVKVDKKNSVIVLTGKGSYGKDAKTDTITISYKAAAPATTETAGTSATK